jgi:hypothetical protein
VVLPELPPELWRQIIRRTVPAPGLGQPPRALQTRAATLRKLCLVSPLFLAIASELLYSHVLMVDHTTVTLLCQTLGRPDRLVGPIEHFIKGASFGKDVGGVTRRSGEHWVGLGLATLANTQLCSVAFFGLTFSSSVLELCRGKPVTFGLIIGSVLTQPLLLRRHVPLV